MQHCLPNRLGGGAEIVPPRPTDIITQGRHHALLLVGPRRVARLDARLSRRVLDRLLVPAAQVEGIDFHLSDPSLQEAALAAQAFALVLPPLGNLTNRFYTVHPRRNDRFVAARPPLRALYPEVEFGPLAFTGHALGTLAMTCPERFVEVQRELTDVWMQRMQEFLAHLPRTGVLMDLPAPAWLRRPPIPGEGRRRVFVDVDDRVTGAEILRARLNAYSA